MKIYRLLQKAGIVRYRLSHLPTEIWEKILEFTLDIPEALGTTCNPENIFEYLYYHRFQQYTQPGIRARTCTKPPTAASGSYTSDPNHPYEVYIRQRVIISLVCSQWNTMVRQSQPAWSFGASHSNFQKVERLELESAYRQTASSHERSSHHVAEDNNWKRLRILAINNRFYGPLLTQNANDVEIALSGSLLYNSEIMGNLECFSYAGSYLRQFDLVCKLFNNLTTLILEVTNTPNLNLELPKVNVLMLKASTINVRGWYCPALQHLVLIYREKSDLTTLFETQPIILPSVILSLIVYNRHITVDEAFWQSYSSLVHIGASSLVYHSPPPPNHPLSYLSILDTVHCDDLPTGFIALTTSGHPLKSVRFSPRDNHSAKHRSEDWVQLYWFAQRRGILGRPVPADLVDTPETPGISRRCWKCGTLFPRQGYAPRPREPWRIEGWCPELFAPSDASVNCENLLPTVSQLGHGMGLFHLWQFFGPKQYTIWRVCIEIFQSELIGMSIVALIVIIHFIYWEC
ncbi:SubName: Full=Uncharacterized protein {ECO:0000313/EMBL:CCA74959.1} [Serendipita indica DSM 11827]|nr:SubName: Full=Uncharacterized protein {ECO:0000313/EMBL:CCA74959.1} [Serendipita indica DSM 11827]